LLSKSGRLHCQTVPRDQEGPHVRECREQSRNHHSDANRFGMSPKLLIQKAADVLMIDRAPTERNEQSGAAARNR